MTSRVWRSKPLAALAAAILILLCFSGSAFARQGEAPVSRNLAAKALDEIPVVSLPAVDAKALLARDEIEKGNRVGPLQFAVPAPVLIDTQNSGVWETLADGSRLWRLRFDSPGATDLNFAFTTYRMPAGGKLWIVAETEDYYEGPYTAGDNESHGQLWTPLVPGGKATVELHLPAETKHPLELELTQVATGYRDILDRNPLIAPKQGACNNDVVCPEGDGWRDQIRSVGWYILNGFETCSGQMIADVPGTFRSFFLTAFHCGISAGNAASMVVIWNDESPNCGDLSGGDGSDNQTGATFLASRQDVDMALVELDDPPNPASTVYFSGWDRTDNIPAGGAVGIHHPSLDEKAISFENDPLTTQDNCIGGGGTDTHWRVNDWDDGTTEPGSSGSGLWNPDNQLLIGFLSGGLAACGNDLFDCYGRFGVAWDGPSASTRLRDHLDPGNTGALTTLGGDPSPTIFYVSNSGVDTCSSDLADDVFSAGGDGVWEPGEEIAITATLRATGDFTGVSAVLSSSTPGVTVVTNTATYADMTSGVDTPSNTPYQVLIDSDAGLCLTDIDFELTITANEDGPFMGNFSETLGAPLTPDTPVSIPDNNPAGATSVLMVGDNVSLADLNVRVNITHTFVGDLFISLTSPMGTTVTLLDRPGQPATMFGCGDNNMNVTFDDESAGDLENLCSGTNSTPWLDGSGPPVNPLSAFDGEMTAGNWTLTVSDNALQDTGQISDWELITDPPISGTCDVCAPAGDADLEIEKSCTATDTTASCDLTVTNNGPENASGVVVDDPIPTGLVYVSDTCAAGPPIGNVLTWNIGALLNGASAVCTVEFMIDPAAPDEIVNVATVSGAGSDPVTSNDTSSAVIRGPDVLEIPTLDHVGLLLMLLTMMGAGIWLVRRR